MLTRGPRDILLFEEIDNRRDVLGDMVFIRPISSRSLIKSIYALTEVVITSTEKVATDSSDVIGLRGVGKSVERVEKEALLAEVLEHAGRGGGRD